jgi:hypothetical protein
VPTGKSVRLHYGYTGIDLGSYALTAVGIGATFWLWRRRDDELEPLESPEPSLAPAQPLFDPEFAMVGAPTVSEPVASELLGESPVPPDRQ